MSCRILLDDDENFGVWRQLLSMEVKNFDWDPPGEEGLRHCSQFPHFNVHATDPKVPFGRLQEWHDTIHTAFRPVFEELLGWLTTKPQDVPPTIQPHVTPDQEKGEELVQHLLRHHASLIHKKFDFPCIQHLHHLHPSFLGLLHRMIVEQDDENQKQYKAAIQQVVEAKMVNLSTRVDGIEARLNTRVDGIEAKLVKLNYAQIAQLCATAVLGALIIMLKR